jgi:hypothetical protein
LNCGYSLVIAVIPRAEDGFASVEVAADAVQVDDAVTADFHGRDGVAFDPAAHHVFGDLLHAQELSQHVFRAERCVAEIRYALGVSRNRKPHYTRLFHANVL